MDYVPLKKKYLTNIKNEDSEQESKKKDFRLTCKYKNCNKKSDLHCVDCIEKNSKRCALCVPICFLKYHKNKI